MNGRIQRGQNQIGRNTIEIFEGAIKILLDAGYELS